MVTLVALTEANSTSAKKAQIVQL